MTNEQLVDFAMKLQDNLTSEQTALITDNKAKFRGKNLCPGLFFKKVTVQAYNFFKKETLVQVFYCEFQEIFQNSYFEEHQRMSAFVN